MGCDIHLHGEIKINGNWEHYNYPHMRRCYPLFAKMAGVRNYEEFEITPIVEPRGMPHDASVVTVFDYDKWLVDAHSHSWLDAVEIAELQDWAYDNVEIEHKWMFESEFWGYLFGNTWGCFHNYPEERPQGLEDVRFVFWFDN